MNRRERLQVGVLKDIVHRIAIPEEAKGHPAQAIVIAADDLDEGDLVASDCPYRQLDIGLTVFACHALIRRDAAFIPSRFITTLYAAACSEIDEVDALENGDALRAVSGRLLVNQW
jgi:hypothetical protein